MNLKKLGFGIFLTAILYFVFKLFFNFFVVLLSLSCLYFVYKATRNNTKFIVALLYVVAAYATIISAINLLKNYS